jgi:hypothetical protein
MQEKGGQQQGLTRGQESSLARSLNQGRQAYPPICKELVERDLDCTISTYIKYRENLDSAERCPSEALRSCKYADMI